MLDIAAKLFGYRAADTALPSTQPKTHDQKTKPVTIRSPITEVCGAATDMSSSVGGIPAAAVWSNAESQK